MVTSDLDGVMPDKLRTTASELKLMIEERLRAGHPDCERAEVIINPRSRTPLVKVRPSTKNAAHGWKASLNSFATSSIWLRHAKIGMEFNRYLRVRAPGADVLSQKVPSR